MGMWTNYDDNTTPASTWTILCYPLSGALQEVALSNVFTQLVGANYARTLNVDATLSTSLQSVEVGGTASALQVATDKAKVAGTFQVTGAVTCDFTVTVSSSALCNSLRVPATANPYVIYADSTTLAFFGASAVTKQTVAGATGGNAALQNLLAALEVYGLITDTTT